MGYQAFDQYASEYDAWFMENRNVLETELRLVASTLRKAGRILSIGSGSGLFEKLLKDRYSIEVARCIEPAEGMAAIARKKGFEVEINTAEAADYGTIYNLALALGTWDHPLLEGCKPQDPYPIELVRQAAWRTTADKANTMTVCGFKDLEYQQTLTLDPCYSYTAIEDPMPGHDRGSYVAIIGYKK